jgi:hypothetical protein
MLLKYLKNTLYKELLVVYFIVNLNAILINAIVCLKYQQLL